MELLLLPSVPLCPSAPSHRSARRRSHLPTAGQPSNIEATTMPQQRRWRTAKNGRAAGEADAVRAWPGLSEEMGLGVNPAVHEVADEAEHAAVFTGDEVVVALPAVFVGALALALGYYYGRTRGFT
ncbi:hypothetical protein ZWY2020_051232 [Hordeum vulgare]|nr:hypothetical protein ZWY2020_051232 [Hordeum vulgare]